MTPITVERCSCGHASCKDHWLVGIGKFMQGSGFNQHDAERIADLLNGSDTRVAALKNALALSLDDNKTAARILDQKELPGTANLLRQHAELSQKVLDDAQG